MFLKEDYAVDEVLSMIVHGGGIVEVKAAGWYGVNRAALARVRER